MSVRLHSSASIEFGEMKISCGVMVVLPNRSRRLPVAHGQNATGYACKRTARADLIRGQFAVPGVEPIQWPRGHPKPLQTLPRPTDDSALDGVAGGLIGV